MTLTATQRRIHRELAQEEHANTEDQLAHLRSAYNALATRIHTVERIAADHGAYLEPIYKLALARRVVCQDKRPTERYRPRAAAGYELTSQDDYRKGLERFLAHTPEPIRTKLMIALIQDHRLRHIHWQLTAQAEALEAAIKDHQAILKITGPLSNA